MYNTENIEKIRKISQVIGENEKISEVVKKEIHCSLDKVCQMLYSRRINKSAVIDEIQTIMKKISD